MRITQSLLRKMSALVVAIPLLVAVISQVVIWFIPGCNPNPYGPGQCAGSTNLALALLAGELGGVYIALVLGLLVSIPLFVASVVVQMLERRRARNAA